MSHLGAELLPMQPTSRWKVALMVGILVLTTVAALWAVVLVYRWDVLGEPTISWVDVGAYLGMYTLTMLGISAGYHRMLTHGAFKVRHRWRIVEYAFLIMGAMAMQMSPVKWATTHFHHHRHTDREDDPHSPVAAYPVPDDRGDPPKKRVRGFPFAHVLWLILPRVQLPIHPKFAENKIAMWVSKYFLLWVILGFVLPTAVGGLFGGWEGAWSAFFWGGLVRLFFQLHATWAVNSIGHMWGYRPFKTLDNSRNNIFVLWVTPEGPHNTHHAIPEGANQALRWYEWPWDYTAWAVLWPLQQLGVIYDVKWITQARIDEAHRQLEERGKLRAS